MSADVIPFDDRERHRREDPESYYDCVLLDAQADAFRDMTPERFLEVMFAAFGHERLARIRQEIAEYLNFHIEGEDGERPT